MADKSRKTQENVPGKWFVDDSCTSCGLCVSEAPDHFDMGNASAYVKKQPATGAEESACQSAADTCPVGAIGAE